MTHSPARSPRWLILCVLLTLTGSAMGCFCGGCSCSSPAPSPYDNVQVETENQPAVVEESTAGGAFNKYFPKPQDGYDVVYTQEKQGFAEAALTKDGADVATLSVSDTANNPSAVEKYTGATEMLAGFPLAASGGQGTGVLVAGRYQVQIRSKDDTFTEAQRKEWLAKFDLEGLRDLENMP